MKTDMLNIYRTVQYQTTRSSAAEIKNTEDFKHAIPVFETNIKNSKNLM